MFLNYNYQILKLNCYNVVIRTAFLFRSNKYVTKGFFFLGTKNKDKINQRSKNNLLLYIIFLFFYLKKRRVTYL